jgi:2-C-methyl-D-erythritol 4-phosphate cytidylyltransferase
MNTAVIVAAGRGTRMGPGIDKLFLEVAGLPVVAHTWRRFDEHPLVDHVCLVVRPGMEPEFEALARQLGVRKAHSFVPGGAERQDSVWNGLSAAPPGTRLVAIQDGARPCTSADTITRCLRAAETAGAAVAAQRAVDTIKEAGDDRRIARHLDRSRLWTVQTPQCFQLPTILSALGEARARGVTVTDDTAACGLIGAPVELVECPDPNPKVTLPSDLRLVALWL